MRPAVKEQVQSLGAEFVERNLDTGSSETAGGYAKAMGEEFYVQQREQLGRIIAECDIVVSTAAIPGRAAPILVTHDAVSKMRAGSVIVDLAAERGGNCEATVPGETVVVDGVTIMGPTNLASDVPFHTSQLYARNISTYLLHLLGLGLPELSLADEICRDTLVARGGQVVNTRVREAAGLPPLDGPAPDAAS